MPDTRDLSLEDIICRGIKTPSHYKRDGKILPQAFLHPEQPGQNCELSFVSKTYLKSENKIWETLDQYVYNKSKNSAIARADICHKDIVNEIQKPIALSLDNHFPGHCSLKMNMEQRILARELANIAKLVIRPDNI